MSLRSLGRNHDTVRPRSLGKPRALLTAIFCAFAALLPIVGVVAPKGTVVLLLLAAVLAIPTHWYAERRFPIPDLRLSVGSIVLVAWCAIASAWSDDTARSLVLALRIAVILAAGMVLFPIAASLEDAARRRVGVWLMVGFGLSLIFIAVEAGLDYPLLRFFKTASPGKEAFWLTRGAVAMALIVWPVTACVWGRGVGWKALAIPIVLGIGSLFVESAAATLGLAAGVAALSFAVIHRKAGRLGDGGSHRRGVRRNAVRRARDASPRMAWGRLVAVVGSAPRRDLGLLCSANCREARARMGLRRVSPYEGAVPGPQYHGS